MMKSEHERLRSLGLMDKEFLALRTNRLQAPQVLESCGRDLADTAIKKFRSAHTGEHQEREKDPVSVIPGPRTSPKCQFRFSTWTH